MNPPITAATAHSCGLLQGMWGDSGQAIALDASGAAILVGVSASPDFPLVHAEEAYPGPGVCGSGNIGRTKTFPCWPSENRGRIR